MQVEAEQEDNSAPNIKALLKSRIAGLEEEDLGFPRFEHFLFAAEHLEMVKVDATMWPQEVYPAGAVSTRVGGALVDPRDWTALITLMHEGGNLLRQAQVRAETARRIGQENTHKIIDVAQRNGVIKSGKGGEIFRLDHENSRVQVYLGFLDQTKRESRSEERP